ncbi:unnamed protein product [Didymodactylos carnosus]|uniref:Uncharacterized protein n=1 Tax=Didymodactylos carnosus TaxID=1234261 RepID=A0A814WS74_9BILA|nr:unnamed protein product [Didymodactylos carnosus]CAF3969783.1 unnamed protein product [Didymodactylos carnosus]
MPIVGRRRAKRNFLSTIETLNGFCQLPFNISTFDIYFCYQPNASTPAYCPTSTNGTTGDCDPGFYGIETFNSTGITSHELLEVDIDIEGYHCLGFFYYFTNGNSNASIKVMSKSLIGGFNETIGLATEWTANKWHEYRNTFEIITTELQV